ncbi:MmgE/PrpD family protein [Thalassospira sp. MCCC 1A02491]|uniref:MmgE/PrpD family protein n=1 Tax=Thalassospira sp. MCCC 1A02491 TaxID=1769751 RepID=UPI0009EDA667|nr:MmgE/PrpD family protein [Thalassospira sp. MCCC 1A02491]
MVEARPHHTVSPISEFATYLANIGQMDIDEPVLHQARRVLIDYIAALLAGADKEPATNLIQALDEEVGIGRCSVTGHSVLALPRAAALINGTASHIVEFDDIFRDGIYHPGCPVIAAAIAACEQVGASQDTLLRSIIAGYEVSTRIAAAIQPSHYRYWHTTGTVGTFGAAAAVAVAFDLNANQAAHALATAGTFAAGLQQAFRSDAMSKPLHAGRAAEGGYLAAVSARFGVTGALDVLEGDAGFGAAMSTDVDWQRAPDGLGDQYNIAQMTVKNHGCCGHTFAAIDGALYLRDLHGFSVDDIDSIRVGTYQVALNVTGNPRHTTPFEGKFNLRYVVAHALVFGSVRLNAFDANHLSDPVIKRLVDSTELFCDPKAEEAFPEARGARVAISLKNRQMVEHYQPTRIGDPDAALSDQQLESKFGELAEECLTLGQARGLLDLLWQVGGGRPSAEIGTFIRACQASG